MVRVPEVVQVVRVGILHTLELLLGVLGQVGVEFAGGLLGGVGLSSLVAHGDYLLDTALSISARNVVHIQQELEDVGQLFFWLVDQILIPSNVDWVFLFSLAVFDEDVEVLGEGLGLVLDPPVPPLWVVLVVAVLWLTRVGHSIAQRRKRDQHIERVPHTCLLYTSPSPRD